MPINNSKDLTNLQIYTRSLELSLEIFKALNNTTKLHRLSELNFIKNQLSRSATSIGSNIAEGYGRLYKKDFKRFLSISRGSCYESLYWIEIANRLGLIDNKNRIKFEEEIKELIKMITSFMKKLET